MNKYKPETRWEADRNFVYNLRKTTFKNRPFMANDVVVSIHINRNTHEHMDEIASTICDALNEKYFKDEEDTDIEKGMEVNNDESI